MGAAGRLDVADVHTATELERDARQVLSSFKVPAQWRIAAALDDIPRSATGKVDKERLRDFIESQP